MPRKSMNQDSPVTRLRNVLGLSQAELANLLGTSNITVGKWERDGVKTKRGSGVDALGVLKGLLKQSTMCPEFIHPALVKKYLRLAARGELAPYYGQNSEELDGEFLQGIGSTLIAGALLGMLYDTYLTRTGQQAASDFIMRETGIEAGKPQTMSDDEMLDRLAE